jgi:Fe2+ or Zn2+ uptake regulation protein
MSRKITFTVIVDSDLTDEQQEEIESALIAQVEDYSIVTAEFSCELNGICESCSDVTCAGCDNQEEHA